MTIFYVVLTRFALCAGEMLGSGLTFLLLVIVLTGRLCVQLGFLASGSRMPGRWSGRQHDPRVEHHVCGQFV